MRLISTLIFLLICINCSKNRATDTMTLTDLELQILDSIHSHEGVFAVVFKILDSTDQFIFINKSTQFHAASTMKTPVMIEAFKRIEQGKFSLNDSLLITNKFKSILDQSEFELSVSDDSEPALYHEVGQYRTVGELIELMIAQSSNLANNILIDYLGATNISQTMVDLGAGGMKVLRGVEDNKAFNAGLNNTTDALSLMIIFEKLGNLQLVSASASNQMIEILERQQHNNVIPALLPPDIKVAHKTGFITGVHHDSGLVFLPDGRKYVLVLLSKDLPDAEAGTKLLQNISKMIYDFVLEN